MRTKALLLAAFTALTATAEAGQQQWASAYVNWSSASTLKGWSLDQQVWLPEPARSSFFTIHWIWSETPKVGGYLGLQTNGAGHGNVRFSLWDATDAKGTDCKPFGGEGVGYTCILPVTINSDKFYRLHLWRTEGDDTGQWWGGWLIEEKNGKLVEHAIGQIKVAAKQNTFSVSSVSNFSEYWGDAVTRCNEVPLSVAVFTPPAINYLGKGVYEASLKLAGGSLPDGNICRTGTESQGALATFISGYGEGMAVLMGGNVKNRTFDRKHPEYLPNN